MRGLFNFFTHHLGNLSLQPIWMPTFPLANISSHAHTQIVTISYELLLRLETTKLLLRIPYSPNP